MSDERKLMRALEKLHDGDTLPAQKRPRYDVLRLGVTWDRPTLCARIDERLARLLPDEAESVLSMEALRAEPRWQRAEELLADIEGFRAA